MSSAQFSAEIQAFTNRPTSVAFEPPSHLFIACSTYNVHSSSISCDLTPWIECHFSGQGPAPDVIVIGMQEITMTPRSLISEETQEGCDWGALLLRDINSCSLRTGLQNGAMGPYVCLLSRQLVGMSLYVFVSGAAHAAVVSASSASLPLGVLSMFGNKGAIEARLLIGSFSLQFINCHLIPHPPNFAKRNQQVQLISEHFPAADFTVFLGDMNYRVDLDSAQVRKLAASGMYGDILAHCQMQKAMQLQDSPFSGFSEAPITFAPSYSYDVGTDKFDSSPKNRIPSYCDRILWRASSRGSLAISCNCSSYHMSPLNASDHKPVVALLQLSMTHDTANSRSSIAAAPIAPMNIGAHSRMRFVSSDSDIDRRRLMLARACVRLSDSVYDRNVMPRPLSCPVPDAVWRGTQIPSLAAKHQDGRWALDDSSTSCMRCGGVFSGLRRRHHCRWCGCLVCGSCCQSTRRLPPGDFGGIHASYKEEQRVCAVCADHLDKGASQVTAFGQA